MLLVLTRKLHSIAYAFPVMKKMATCAMRLTSVQRAYIIVVPVPIAETHQEASRVIVILVFTKKCAISQKRKNA